MSITVLNRQDSVMRACCGVPTMSVLFLMLDCTPIDLSENAVAAHWAPHALQMTRTAERQHPSDSWALFSIAAWNAELSAEIYHEACAGPTFHHSGGCAGTQLVSTLTSREDWKPCLNLMRAPTSKFLPMWSKVTALQLSQKQIFPLICLTSMRAPQGEIFAGAGTVHTGIRHARREHGISGMRHAA